MRPPEVSQIAPGIENVFYMLLTMYLGNIIDPEAPADVSGPLKRSGHSIVTSRHSSAGSTVWEAGYYAMPGPLACWLLCYAPTL